MEFFLDLCEDLLYYWGYAKEGDNKYGFFDYKGKAKDENVAKFEGFKK